jgi:hypothetical protein
MNFFNAPLLVKKREGGWNCFNVPLGVKGEGRCMELFQYTLPL